MYHFPAIESRGFISAVNVPSLDDTPIGSKLWIRPHFFLEESLQLSELQKLFQIVRKDPIDIVAIGQFPEMSLGQACLAASPPLPACTEFCYCEIPPTTFCDIPRANAYNCATDHRIRDPRRHPEV